MKISGMPHGYRFRPSDSDLILNYLHPKVTSSSSDANNNNNIYHYTLIPECDLYDPQEPWKRYFAGREAAEPMYFYTKLKGKAADKTGSRPERSFGGHVWKSQNAEPVTYGKETVIGSKRSFSYKVKKGHENGTGNRDENEWVMVEFELSEVLGGRRGKAGDQFVVCSVKKKVTRGEGSSSSSRAVPVIGLIDMVRV
ncbi:NAC domain-containing protein JA2L [Linum perenne]